MEDHTPFGFITLELIYFPNSHMDSGSNHVSESQAFVVVFLYLVCIFRRSHGKVGTLVYGKTLEAK